MAHLIGEYWFITQAQKKYQGRVGPRRIHGHPLTQMRKQQTFKLKQQRLTSS